MSAVVIAGDTSGSITLDAPAVAGTTTLTLPATSGTVLTSTTTQAGLPPNIAGNGPAFSAGKSATQTLSAATFTKVTYDTETFDTNNNFASSTFTPTVSGYYQISSSLYTGTNTLLIITLYKNGSNYQELSRLPASASGLTANGTVLVYCNGTTDYIELYAYLVAGGTIGSSALLACFSGVLVRSA
jgi:hypothetical protein